MLHIQCFTCLLKIFLFKTCTVFYSINELNKYHACRYEMSSTFILISKHKLLLLLLTRHGLLIVVQTMASCNITANSVQCMVWLKEVCGPDINLSSLIELVTSVCVYIDMLIMEQCYMLLSRITTKTTGKCQTVAIKPSLIGDSFTQWHSSHLETIKCCH